LVGWNLLSPNQQSVLDIEMTTYTKDDVAHKIAKAWATYVVSSNHPERYSHMMICPRENVSSLLDIHIVDSKKSIFKLPASVVVESIKAGMAMRMPVSIAVQWKDHLGLFALISPDTLEVDLESEMVSIDPQDFYLIEG